MTKGLYLNKRAFKIGLTLLLVISTSFVFAISQKEKQQISFIKTGDLSRLISSIKKDADPNLLFTNGKSGLYYAIRYDHEEIARFLLEKGANPNLITEKTTLLEWAIKYNRRRTARYLIEYGADVNQLDNKLNSPLNLASRLNNRHLCKILIDRGANPLQENLKKKKASDYAIFWDNQKTYNYLKQMEKISIELDSISSYKDGPYIEWENKQQIVMKYFERKKELNRTRLIEKTIFIGKNDTSIQGLGNDSIFYSIRPTYPPKPYKINTTGPIFALGDIHGKCDVLQRLLMNNKIIDADNKWIFENGNLILLGDAFDRGPQVTETLWFLHELDNEAKKVGGNVQLLLGNHEIMALTGDHRYIHQKYEYFTAFTQMHYFQLFDKNSILGEWLRSQNAILQINNHLFMHAGISPAFSAYNYDFAEVNFILRNFLYSDFTILPNSPEENILGGNGPLWFRGYMNYGERAPQVEQRFIDNYLDSVQVEIMFLGHNEQKEISSSYEGKVISLDVFINESGETAQGLLIKNQKLIRCHADGSQEEIR